MKIGLSSKLILGFGLSLVLMVLVMLIYQGTVDSVTSDYTALMGAEVKTAEIAQNVDSLMQQCLLKQREFQLSSNPEDVQEMSRRYVMLADAIESLSRVVHASDRSINPASIQKIATYSISYYTAFTNLVSEHQARGLTRQDGLQGEFYQIAERLAAAVSEVGVQKMNEQLLDLRLNEKNYLLWKGTEDIQQTRQAVESLLATVAASSLKQKDASILNEALKSYQELFNKLVEADNRILEYDQQMAAELSSFTKAVKAVLMASNEGRRDKINAANAAAIDQLRMAQIMGVLTIAFGFLAALMISRSITRPLYSVMSSLGESSGLVSDASEQVNTVSQDMAGASNEQASSLEETSASLEEMGSMTHQNMNNAEQANRSMKDAIDLVQGGVSSMRRMNKAIDEIGESARRSAAIIRSIDDIASQTNLLALNAAVEAARAGEAGKGFAVVADEIRSLAQRSAESARETSELIDGSQTNATAGIRVAQEVAMSLDAIEEIVSRAGTRVDEITAASREQYQGIEQVNLTMAEMDKVVQQTSANAEESSSAAKELMDQANDLNVLVKNLQRIVDGGEASEVKGASGRTSAADSGAASADAPDLDVANKPRGGALKTIETGTSSSTGPKEYHKILPLDDEDTKDF